ncbi:hypothetical protein DdX_21877 [Ditylenchus destructor]|uniref:F-box domain-containing protein n=1 Tax=Ditylenchus destructor TaxID=166010 RepID=A0AAD4MEV8_9BILA|nr:hypothetical protein DdX_21877 [Ditylenchus destructor]
MDNGTLVEVFKFLNYCQLAKNSLVSKRFSNLIRTHRHSLGLLYVNSISVKYHYRATAFIKVFTKQLSPKAYNEWVIRNQYSKQIPLEDQVGRMHRRQYEHNVYRIFAQAVYKDPNHHPLWNDMTTVFYASTKLDHVNWPLFQQFVRLLSDPSIYIRCLELTSQNDVFNLLARSTSSDRNRLQCKNCSLVTMVTLRNLSAGIAIIATMDNGTIVEVLKYLDYCGLARSSLVSKWFRDLIRSHRHKLALICTNAVIPRSSIQIFGQKLRSNTTNGSFATIIPKNFSLKLPGSKAHTIMAKLFSLVLQQHMKDNWHLFQHFVRLLTDPFIYIRDLELMITQDDGLNLLIEAMDTGCSRLKCKKLKLNLDSNAQKSMGWIKGHVSCKELTICNNYRSKYDQELLDFFVTGAHCASWIRIAYCVLSKVIVDLIQKFLDLKNSDDYQFVESIVGNAEDGDVEVLTNRYAKFLVKKKVEEYGCTLHVFEFVNNDVGKKLQLTLTKWSYTRYSRLSIYRTRREWRFCADNRKCG